MDINVSYDHHTSLIVIDVQNDFADPAGERPVRANRRQASDFVVKVAVLNL